MIDPVAPRVPLRQHRLGRAVGELLAVVLDGEIPELPQLGRDAARGIPEVPRDPRRQDRIGVVLVGETRRLLEERHSRTLPR